MSNVERRIVKETQASRPAAAWRAHLAERSRVLVQRAMLATLLALAACTPTQQIATAPPPPPAPAPQPKTETFEATAYSIEGETATGDQTRKGIVAADPDILPLGSRIRVHDAGAYSGEYVVSDTGRTINGREIDIYLPSDREAKKFGRKTVQVERLSSAK